MSAPGPPGRGLVFAERQLRRHGWRRGQGLGRQEHGIAEPIRVKVKCGTAGVGHDASEPFSFHWWDHVFNQAAANIAVEAGQDGISLKALSKQGVRISNRKPHKASGTPGLLYGRFVKSATLTAHGEEPAGSASSEEEEEEEEEELDLSSARRQGDEELMRVCGGRTAHKGARHGLTMSAKLARLEEQERAFLATLGHEEPPERQGKKRQREECRDGASAEALQRQGPSEEEEGDEGKAAKRKKKKHQEPNGEEEVAGEEGKAARRKKKQQQQQEDKEEPIEEPVVVEKKKRKKQEKENEEESIVMEMEKKKQKENKEKPIVMEKKKRKKENKEEPTVMGKKKRQQQQDKEEPAEAEMPLEDTDGPDQASHSPRKKKKRRRKKDPE
ncbi:G patch domain-containing protein 4 [Pezoporus occidentalis]|uniref:G patch domain-containing protein 4 n=1 Tax=Pezoporus occidentalis TaxID=407982 RepID=UPI002F918893